MKKTNSDNQLEIESMMKAANELMDHLQYHEASMILGPLVHELRKSENLGRSPDYFDSLMIWNWVREKHDLNVPQTVVEELETLFFDEKDDFDVDQIV